MLVLTSVAMVAAVGAGGCANGIEYEPQVETTTPMTVDEAMQARDWEPVAVSYANGDTIGGIDRAPVKPRYVTNSEYVQGGAAPFLFIGQALAVPFSFLWAPPFEPVATQGEVFHPTYTGAPPIPADQLTPEEEAEQRQREREEHRQHRGVTYTDRDVVQEHGRNVFPDEPAPRPVVEPAPDANVAPPADGTPMEPVPAPAPDAATPPPTQTPALEATPARPAVPDEPVPGPGAPGQAVPNEAVPAQPAPPAQPQPELNK